VIAGGAGVVHGFGEGDEVASVAGEPEKCCW
jgi:hypothetical protein